MAIEELIRQGELAEALQAAKSAVREHPAEARHRILLFQLLCIGGQWESAFTQLSVLQDMDADTSLFAHIFGPVVECEVLRGEIFEGKRTPIVFGEPQPWVGKLVQAHQHGAGGEWEAAACLRSEALDEAEAVPGSVNGTPFEWIADADSRLGPIFEVIMDGCYRWVPTTAVSSIQIEPPNDLRDLVWIPARFIWVNGGTATGFLPVRYPGSENSSEKGIPFSRRTEWSEPASGTFLGLGQRVLTTDSDEYSLLEVRELAFRPVVEGDGANG
jgi:type VI secretion system protein ImpE